MNVQKRRSVDGGPGKPKSTLAAMQDIEKKRQERRQQMEERKADKRAEEKRNAEQGLLGDADFVKMIGAWREARPTGAPHVPFDCGDVATAGSGNEICICVRKRPIGRREVAANDHDAVSCVHPAVVVHDCRHRVDGITKYLNNTQFAFDHAFSEAVETEEVYACVGAPLVDFVVSRRGRATIFAYGQTGSGKTYTMEGIQDRAAYAVFTALGNAGGVNVGVSFFEIYGGRCQDLLRDRARLQVREDGKGEVNVVGLSEAAAPSPEALLETIREGNELRTKQRTEMNDASSRSHAICSICLREKASGKLLGKLSLVDLAGSERGQDTRSHNRQLRTESAEINKSLLALKECIRGLATRDAHVPFRASKLTMVLRDSFVRPHCRVAMIATVSPSVSATDHTINTLRYADRVKEKQPHAVQPLSERNAAAEANERRGGAKDDRPPSARAGRRRARATGAGPRRRRAARAARPRPRPRAGPWAPARRAAPTTRAARRAAPGGARAARARAAGRGRQVRYAPPGQGARAPRDEAKDDVKAGPDDPRPAALHRTVDSLFEEEEALLNAHMNVIQENAELLTEEGRMLQQVQGGDVPDYDIDTYVSRLQAILDRKAEQIATLQAQLHKFAKKLREEEDQSQRVHQMPMW
ncbi:microtubule motor protein [Aureococcus anophagefferens]|uniref:Kinesin-like protein n=1 Tax=Aureococcus anophagefferens TaxID=44056 RepID=A0ABR1FGJ9_AURAN